MDGKTLLLLSGRETWVGPEMAYPDTVQLLTHFSDRRFKQYKQQFREENASAPTRHHLYCHHLQ
jgi:hypothetical protein